MSTPYNHYDQIAAIDRWIARQPDIDAEFLEHDDGTSITLIYVALSLVVDLEEDDEFAIETGVQIAQALEMRLKRDHGLVTPSSYGLDKP